MTVRMYMTRGAAKYDAGSHPITLAEWKAVVDAEPDMHAIASPESEYTVEWTGSPHRDEHPAHRSILHWYRAGIVTVPAMGDDDIHFLRLARKLKARVFGEDSDEYTIEQGKVVLTRGARRRFEDAAIRMGEASEAAKRKSSGRGNAQAGPKKGRP